MQQTFKWNYGETAPQKGLLLSVAYPGQSVTYTHDTCQRVTNETVRFSAGEAYVTRYTYDGASRIASVVYPSGFTVNHHYNARGYQSAQSDFDGDELYRTKGTTPMGQTERFVLGGILSNNLEYDPQKQLLTRTKTQKNGSSVQNFSFDYDGFCNLATRKDNRTNMEERFGYDEVNRLTGVWLGSAQTGASAYDGYGRMTAKYLHGEMVFDSTAYWASGRPHALKTARMYSYQPDMETRYTSFDKLQRIQMGNTSLSYQYGYEHQRLRMDEMVGNDTVRTKVYAGNCEFVTEDNGAYSTSYSLTYLSGPLGVFAVRDTRMQPESRRMYYVHPDHLGSWTTLTAWNGNVVQDVWFDPWGTAHNITPGGEPSPVFSLLFDRGFTGHEHMMLFGLINMNGRVYDPVTSSFLSVDNYVQDPSYTQNFNRYAYCMNNPLKYTDPDGEFFILDSWIVGFVSKFFQTGSFKQSWSEANSRAANDAKIWGGLFVTDSNKGFWGRTWELISRFTWQAPQTVIGWAWSQSKNIVGAVDRVDYLGGATFVTNEKWKKTGKQGITIGNYINIDMHGEVDKDDFAVFVTHNQLYMHEYGHYIQSQRWGPLYIPVIGLPSFISAARDKSIPNDPYHASTHDYFWTEYRANRNAAEYFNLHYDVVWNEFGFPLDDYRQVNKH